MLYALEPREADWYTVWGFWIGAVSFLLGGVGLALTYWQVLKVRRASDAAKAMFDQNLASVNRYFATVLHRQISEVQDYVTSEKWDFAALRCEDIAAGLAVIGNEDLVAEFRAFVPIYKKISGPRSVRQWKALLAKANKVVDHAIAPFGTGNQTL
jgi:hypothetical protein